MLASAGGDTMAAIEATRQHATSILALLHAHAYLLNHLNDFFVCRCWDDVPPEWQPFLLSLSAKGLATLPSMTRPVSGAPASLVGFIALAASLALPRTPSQEEATRLCWASVSARAVSLSVTAPSSCGEKPYPSNNSSRGMAPTLPPNAPGLTPVRPCAAAEAAAASTAEELWQGMDAKKAHEVARMAPCVAARARAAGCQRVLDVGCGQGYVDRLLAARHLVCKWLLASADYGTLSSRAASLKAQGAPLRPGGRGGGGSLGYSPQLDTLKRRAVHVHPTGAGPRRAGRGGSAA